MDWLHVDHWLLTLYKEKENIPEFERTTKNYNLLNNLKTININSTKLVDAILNTTSPSTTVDYHLSHSGHEALESLAFNAHLLGLDKTELSNYFTAITKLSMNGMYLNLQESSLDEIDHKLNECQNTVNEELHHMKNVLTMLQQNARDDSIQKRRLEEGTAATLAKKNYLALESKYNGLDIERKGLRLNKLNELDASLTKMDAELKEKNAILTTTYADLPADMVLASVKIQETQDQLHELESEREHLLSDIAKSVLS